MTCNNKAKPLQFKVFKTTFKTFDSPKNEDVKYSSILILQQYALYALANLLESNKNNAV